MTVERLEARAKSRTAQARRTKRLPSVIDATINKLGHLLDEAERRDVPIEDDWRWRWEALHSRYLTEPNLINQEWERTIKHARFHNKG